MVRTNKVPAMERIVPKFLKGSAPLRALFLVALVGVVCVGVSVVEGIAGVDAIARRTEENLVRNGWFARQAEQGASISAETDWDEAVVRLDNYFDPVWAQANVGAFLTQRDAFERVAILDHANAPIFATDIGAVVRPEADQPLASVAAPLIAAVRAEEAARGPFTTHGRQKRMISSPIQANAVSMIDGQPFMLYATLVQPDFGSAQLHHERAPIVLAGTPIDASYLAPLSHRYLLSLARLTPAALPLRRGEASVTIPDMAGRPMVSIRWRPQAPGVELFRRTRTVGGVVLASFALILLVFYGATRRAYADLVQNKAQLKLALAASEESSIAKTEFLASMSHEIRTPLNGVIGALHLLRREPVSADGAVLLETALASGEMVAALINDVLDFSRIEAGQMTLAPTPTDLGATVRAVADPFRGPCEAKGVALSVEVEPDIGWARLDWLRLRQCLFNLVGNAVKFTGEGAVRVQAGIEHRAQGRMLCIRVSDTGIGISEAAKSVLFERFRQADGSTTRRYGGSGLGLAITRQLAELMGGTVCFSSQVGVGSTFVLELPAPIAEPAVAAASVETTQSPLAGIVVLVVDDNATNRLIASKMLEQLGAEVAVAEGGAEAIALAKATAFDLVLMDIQMPGMDGIEATRRLRRETALGDQIPIVALTANVFDEQRQLYLASGMDAVVGKPIRPADLLREIYAAAERREVTALRASA
jgi:signal transduction histidine kinase/CheY-like chemotaxis protein